MSTLLEAAQAAKGALPPPKLGTQATGHCTHWTEAGELCCQCNQIIPDEQWGARTCPPANSPATQEIDPEPVIVLEFDYLGRKSTQEDGDTPVRRAAGLPRDENNRTARESQEAK